MNELMSFKIAYIMRIRLANFGKSVNTCSGALSGIRRPKALWLQHSGATGEAPMQPRAGSLACENDSMEMSTPTAPATRTTSRLPAQYLHMPNASS